MSTGNQFNQYGQILSTGGEIAIAFAMLRGADVLAVRSRLEKRYGPMPDNIWAQLLGIARETIAAGETLEGLPSDERPSPDMVVRNPFLFGDDWSGKRVRIITNSVNEMTGEPVDFWWDLPDLYERAELEEYWADQMRDYMDNYARLARWLAAKRMKQNAKHTIIIAERRY
jgi:hypothetical protein